ncbi:MAG: hypothetical protein ACI8UO_006184 [Verrucomicrobiales bacterium]|jgi:hypothetical protein
MRSQTAIDSGLSLKMSLDPIDKRAKEWADWSRKYHLVVWCAIAAPAVIVLSWSALVVLNILEIRALRIAGYWVLGPACLLGILISVFGIMGWFIEKWATKHSPSWIWLALLVCLMLGSFVLLYAFETIRSFENFQD